MSNSTTFSSGTLITHQWLNDINNCVFNGVLQNTTFTDLTNTPLTIAQGVITPKISLGAPVTVTATSYTWTTSSWVIFNSTGTCTVTLPNASTNVGFQLMLKTTAAYAVNSATANVIPLVGGSAGVGILSNTAGKWATLVSDGSNWIIMASN